MFGMGSHISLTIQISHPVQQDHTRLRYHVQDLQIQGHTVRPYTTMLHLFQNARCDMLLLQSSREVHGKARWLQCPSWLWSEVSPHELNDQLPNLDGPSMGTNHSLFSWAYGSLGSIVSITNHKQPTINLCHWGTASLRLVASLLKNRVSWAVRRWVHWILREVLVWFGELWTKWQRSKYIMVEIWCFIETYRSMVWWVFDAHFYGFCPHCIALPYHNSAVNHLRLVTAGWS